MHNHGEGCQVVQTVTPPSGNQERTDSGRADRTWVGSSDLGLRPSLHPDATTCCVIWAFQSTSGSLSFFLRQMEALVVPSLRGCSGTM